MIKVFEAFAGVGSQRMALRNLGIEHEVVGICEIDKFALKSYEAIHGECPNFGDISKVDVNNLPNMDLFTYSFPCQDLSIAGKQKGLGEGTRSGLLYECEKIIEAKRPKYLLLENVKNLVGKKFKNDFDEWLRYLENLGYKNYWKVLNAKDYGVPQNRERIFVISIFGEHNAYSFPTPVKLDKCIKDILEDSVDEKFYINKSFKLVNKSHIAELDMKGHEQIKRVYSEFKTSPCLTTMQGGHKQPKILVERIEQYVRVRKNRVEIEELKKELKESKARSKLTIKEIALKIGVDKTKVEHWFRGDSSFSIPSDDIWLKLKDVLNISTDKFDRSLLEFEVKLNKFDQSNRVYRVDGISPTLTCKNEASADKTLTSQQAYMVRKLTPLECWRLMSFSDEDFFKAKNTGISNNQLYKQAGNSIVLKVLEGIFENLFLYKDKTEKDLVKTTTVKIKNKNIEYNQLKWVL